MRDIQQVCQSSVAMVFKSIMFAALVACLLLTGCEKTLDIPEKPADSATISGTVTLNGKPLSGGNVAFYSLQFGMAGQSPLDSQGKFALPDPVAPGEYRIFFITGNGQPLSGMPAKYMSETSSDYDITVEGSDNQLAIDIKP